MCAQTQCVLTLRSSPCTLSWLWPTNTSYFILQCKTSATTICNYFLQVSSSIKPLHCMMMLT